MNNNLGKNVMNFNDSRQNSQPTIQMHNFMPMPSSSAQIDHEQSEAERCASFEDQMKQNMQSFWRERLSEICNTPTDVRIPNTLPLARIKKVIKSDEKVKMMSADTPAVFGKACEIFVMEVMMRAWMHAQQNNRKTLQRDDIAHAIRDDHILAFLNNVVPTDHPDHHHHHHEEVAARPMAMAPHDHHQIQMAFPMNLHLHTPNPNPNPNPNPGFSGSNRGMLNNPTPPSSSDDGSNPYNTFKEYFG